MRTMRVLIAEDDPLSGRLLQRAVDKFGYESQLARDGKEAWRLFTSGEVEVIISDWTMPDLDGVELCRRVREYTGASYTYFIFMTAHNSKEYFLTGMEAGADDYLLKPVDLTELKVSLIAAERVTSLHRKLNSQKAELERLNLELSEQARRDPLTHLFNRLRLREDFEEIRNLMDRYGHRFAFALCDIDHFKAYNDHYGHLAGDDALRAVAGAISEQCRASDLAYRFGGEEFLVIFPEQSIPEAVTVAERLREAVEAVNILHEAKDPPGVLTISVGVSACDHEMPKHPEVLVKEADVALYHAKTSGKNRVIPITGVIREKICI